MKQVGYDNGWFHNSRVWTISDDGVTVYLAGHEKGRSMSDQYLVVVRASDAWTDMWKEIDWKNPNEFQKNLRCSIYSLPKTLRTGRRSSPPSGVHVTSTLTGAKKVRTQCVNLGLEASIVRVVWQSQFKNPWLEEVDA